MDEEPTRNELRKPPWLNRKLRYGREYSSVVEILERENLKTVCDGARCPNRGECFSKKTATFLIMGDRCSRNCGFCAVPHGGMSGLDPGEPESVANASRAMELKHVVITSVTRDDLPDGGSGHFAETVKAVKELCPEATVEVLVPDFKGRTESLDEVLQSGPDVLNHNMETVERLYGTVRPQADYDGSLEVLRRACSSGFLAKSGFMVGLGETKSEIRSLVKDLRNAGCSVLTIGQYLKPHGGCLPVERYWSPREFEDLKMIALTGGIRFVSSGPFVRSSYNAEAVFKHAMEDEDSITRDDGATSV